MFDSRSECRTRYEEGTGRIFHGHSMASWLECSMSWMSHPCRAVSSGGRGSFVVETFPVWMISLASSSQVRVGFFWVFQRVSFGLGFVVCIPILAYIWCVVEVGMYE